MSKEIKVKCLLREGECPPACPSYEIAKQVTEEFGDKFDPAEFRHEIVFADAFNHDTNISQIQAALGRCLNERKAIEKLQQQP